MDHCSLFFKSDRLLDTLFFGLGGFNRLHKLCFAIRPALNYLAFFLVPTNGRQPQPMRISGGLVAYLVAVFTDLPKVNH